MADCTWTFSTLEIIADETEKCLQFLISSDILFIAIFCLKDSAAAHIDVIILQYFLWDCMRT